ncbi:hypothetical protein BHM03_00020643 [Ensete ventricosum]|nr:hypothetical protein BHM03_00020643 [Ensete ventricosum]
MFVLPRVEVAAPMKAHWTNLLALACLWNDGPIVVKYARGTLYSSVARQLYGAPSEGLVDQVMKSMVWVTIAEYKVSWGFDLGMARMGCTTYECGCALSKSIELEERVFDLGMLQVYALAVGVGRSAASPRGVLGIVVGPYRRADARLGAAEGREISFAGYSRRNLYLWAGGRLSRDHKYKRCPQLTRRIESHPSIAMGSLLPPLLCSLLVSTLFGTSHALDPPRKGLDGGWTAIEDLKDPHVREIAVSEHNKLEKTNLTLRKVEGGESQMVAWMNYRLVLEVRDGSGASARYEAVVWEKTWEHFRKLTSYRKLVRSLSVLAVGGWTPIKNISDPDVGEIAEFAVAEHNHEASTNLTLCKVVKGDTQEVAGINYKLVLEAKDGGVGVVSEYEAVVWEKTWEHFRKLTSFELLETH